MADTRAERKAAAAAAAGSRQQDVLQAAFKRERRLHSEEEDPHMWVLLMGCGLQPRALAVGCGRQLARVLPGPRCGPSSHAVSLQACRPQCALPAEHGRKHALHGGAAGEAHAAVW